MGDGVFGSDVGGTVGDAGECGGGCRGLVGFGCFGWVG